MFAVNKKTTNRLR